MAYSKEMKMKGTIGLRPISSMLVFQIESLELPDELNKVKNDIRLCIIKYNSALSAFNDVKKNLDDYDPTKPTFPENADSIYIVLGRTGNLLSDALRVMDLIKVIHHQLNKNGSKITFPSEIRDNKKAVRSMRNKFEHTISPTYYLSNNPQSCEAERVKIVVQDWSYPINGMRPILIESKDFLIEVVRQLEIIYTEESSSG